MNIVIRPFCEIDRPALHALTVEAFTGVSIDQNVDRILGPIAGRDWCWRKIQHVEYDLENHAEVAVAAHPDTNRAVGYITLHFQREARIGWIHNMAVAAELRSLGLGRRLLEHALARFRAEGMTIAQIETLEQNAIGCHLYPALGFREVARKIYYALPLEGEPERGSAPKNGTDA
jgi:ribosomal protein S18 acetylase RimI-like enzyme